MKKKNTFQIIVVFAVLFINSFSSCKKNHFDIPEPKTKTTIAANDWDSFDGSASARSACPDCDVILTSQTEIDSFVVWYPSVPFINGDLTIKEGINETISSLEPLSFLLEIIGDLDVDGTGTLSNLEGLHNLTTVGGDLSITNNNALESLSGLASLTDCIGNIRIVNNAALQSITNGNNLSSVYIDLVTIQGNPQLAICAEPFLCEFLDNGGQATIINNAQGCNSVNQVKADCAATMKCGTFKTRSWATHIQSHKAKINWDLVNEAESYKVRYRIKNSTAPWKNKTTTNTYKTLFNLQSSTNYEWQIRALCPNGWSDWGMRRYFKTKP